MGQKIAPRFLFSAIAGGLMCAFLMGAATSARAASLPLVFPETDPLVVLPSSTVAPGLDISLEVFVGDFDAGNAGNEVKFLFSNNSVSPQTTAAITEIYLETGLGAYLGGYLGATTVAGTVDLTRTTAPHPSVGGGIDWDGNFDAFDKFAQGDPIAPGESWYVLYQALAGASDTDTLAGIMNTDLSTQIAMHITKGVFNPSPYCNDSGDDSCWVVTWPEPIPVPPALPLFLSGLVGLGAMARRRMKKPA